MTDNDDDKHFLVANVPELIEMILSEDYTGELPAEQAQRLTARIMGFLAPVLTEYDELLHRMEGLQK
jgi:hypothetical protein